MQILGRKNVYDFVWVGQTEAANTISRKLQKKDLKCFCALKPSIATIRPNPIQSSIAMIFFEKYTDCTLKSCLVPEAAV